MNEKEMRINYQNKMYEICNIVDKYTGKSPSKGTGCTISTVAFELNKLLAKYSELPLDECLCCDEQNIINKLREIG